MSMASPFDARLRSASAGAVSSATRRTRITSSGDALPQISARRPVVNSRSHFPAFSWRTDTGMKPGIPPDHADFSTITTALVGRSVRHSAEGRRSGQRIDRPDFIRGWGCEEPGERKNFLGHDVALLKFQFPLPSRCLSAHPLRVIHGISQTGIKILARDAWHEGQPCGAAPPECPPLSARPDGNTRQRS